MALSKHFFRETLALHYTFTSKIIKFLYHNRQIIWTKMTVNSWIWFLYITCCLFIKGIILNNNTIAILSPVFVWVGMKPEQTVTFTLNIIKKLGWENNQFFWMQNFIINIDDTAPFIVLLNQIKLKWWLMLIKRPERIMNGNSLEIVDWA